MKRPLKLHFTETCVLLAARFLRQVTLFVALAPSAVVLPPLCPCATRTGPGICAGVLISQRCFGSAPSPWPPVCVNSPRTPHLLCQSPPYFPPSPPQKPNSGHKLPVIPSGAANATNPGPEFLSFPLQKVAVWYVQRPRRRSPKDHLWLRRFRNVLLCEGLVLLSS